MSVVARCYGPGEVIYCDKDGRIFYSGAQHVIIPHNHNFIPNRCRYCGQSDWGNHSCNRCGATKED